jgi:hypothetical protein
MPGAPEMDELAVARAIRDGELPSPQRYANLLLVALRVTGVGAAYRRGADEFVWRDPSLYLTDEFLARCNGLPVIIEHPDGNILDSDAFRDRIIGSVMLPFIRGEEVWAVARIYDAAAAHMLETERLSTSPAVVLGGVDDKTVELSNGKHLLIEGAPVLLDHLAICALGTFDKGGPPSGVANSLLISPMETDMADENKDDGKLDRVLSHLEGLAAKQEAHGAKIDSLCTRMDALEKAPGEETRADSGVPLAALPAAERERYTAAQVRADRAYQAFGDSAPHALNGETLRAYRCRLAGVLKRHSATYKDSNLSAIADEAALGNVEEQIYADAIKASMVPPPAGAPLSQRTSMDEFGRRVTKFYGDPAVAYAPFSFGGLVQRGRITPPNELRKH